MVQTHDDGFHEIQLNGKQLVFLFMAATVVSVVIFLCGVLVGRGVRAERGLVADPSVGSVSADPTPQQAAAAPAPTSAGSDPTTAAPPPAVDELSYPSRLKKPNAPDEQLKAAPSPPAVAPPAAGAPVEKAAPAGRETPAPLPTKNDAAAVRKDGAKDEAATARVAAAPEAGAEPPGQGYAVQIAALNVRSEAEQIARRLSSKGYAAYVLSPASGTPMVFRVRVGKFGTRREAEAIAAKLQREEQFKPWITR
jgi:cell division septation protein DedD